MSPAVTAPGKAQLIEYAERLFSPLITEGVFRDFEHAFQALLLDYIDEKIASYRDRVSQFESQHQQSFDEFSASLQGRAIPEQEDDWMDWEVAVAFLQKWQRIREQLSSNGAA